jgi:hypothetical protein
MSKFAHKPKKYASLPFKLRIIRVQQDAPEFRDGNRAGPSESPELHRAAWIGLE